MGTPEAGKQFLEVLTKETGYFDSVLGNVRDVRVPAPGRLLCTLLVDESMQNRNGTLHGGCTATIVDTVGSAALVTMSTRPGVSIAITTTYLAGMPKGEDVEVEAKVARTGKTIATINVELRRKLTGELVAQGTHTKFLPGYDALLHGPRPAAPPSKL